MMMHRRDFILSASLASVMGSWQRRLGEVTSSVFCPYNEVDWQVVRDQFSIQEWDKIHFNSGSSGVLPKVVENHYFDLLRQMNRMAPYVAWSIWQEELKSIKQRLGELIKAPAKHLSLVRNTTEGLNTFSSCLRLESGDEVISASFDYPYAANDWQTKQRQEGIVVVAPDVAIPASDDEVIEAYKKAISPKTRVMHITHMTHREGHIMPVKELVALARERNIITVIDGAHVVGQIGLNLSDIDPDCYVSSLHKWLNAPHGNGLLYINPRVIPAIRNFPSAPEADIANNAQFTHIGTRSFPTEIGLGASLDFHDMIGPKVKYERLQYLKHYWTDQLKDDARFVWHTDLSDDKSCSVVTIGIKGKSGGKILKELDEDYNIHAKSVGVKGGGVRISPNVFTTKDELNQLVHALQAIATS